MANANGLNNTNRGDFTIVYSNSGGSVLNTVSNTSNTASSAAIHRATVAGTSGGDALHQSFITGGSSWSWGPDTSDSGTWKLNPASSIGSGDVFTMSTAGAGTFSTTLGVGGAIGVSDTFTVTSNTSSDSQSSVRNSNTGTGAVRHYLLTAAAATGDLRYCTYTNGVATWAWGNDTSASNSWKLSQDAELGNNDSIIVTTGGLVTTPRQTFFSAAVQTTTTNQTGDGTAYTVIFNQVFNNVGSAYNGGTGVFTAPIATTYIFSAGVLASSLGAGHTQGNIDLNFNSGGFSVTLLDCNPAAVRTVSGGDSNNFTFHGTMQIALSAGDTVKVVLTVSASTKTVGAFGSGQYSWFMGRMLG
jgi:hypothetical protein